MASDSVSLASSKAVAESLEPRGVLATAELFRRPRRAANLAAEAAASHELSALMVSDPRAAIQRFLDLALDLCQAGSSGLSLLDQNENGETIFRWDALAGSFAPYIGGSTLRHFSPCGLCLDEAHTILVSRPGRVFDYFRAASHPITEGLVVPLYDTGKVALGTIWIVHHDAARHFDAEDARVMEQLAVQMVLAVKLTKKSAADEARQLRLEQRRKELLRINRELLRSGEFTAQILASSDDCIKVLDLDAKLEFMSAGGQRVMEVDDFNDIAGCQWFSFWHGPHEADARAAVEAARAGGIGRFQGGSPTAKGTAKWWDVQVTPIRGPDGKPEKLLAISRDITALKLGEERQDLLMTELQHRVKNTLASVLGIAGQTFREASSLEEGRSAFTARIMAMSRAHDTLGQKDWASAPVAALIARSIEPFGAGRFSFDGGAAVQVGSKAALALGLALHELCTNAAKYGALSCPAGRVAIGWRVDASGNQPVFRLTWQESGGPVVAPPQRKGFGTRLMEHGFGVGIGAQARIRYDLAGVSCTIEAPLDALQRD
jgi:two-component sensor histidine kinase